MEFDAFVSALFARAKAEGIEHAEVYYASGDSLRVRVRDQKIEDYTVSTRAGLSLRGVCGGRMGYASTEALDEAAVDLLVQGVRETAALIDAPEEQDIFPGSPAYAKVEQHAVKADPQALIDRAMEMERQMQGEGLQVDDSMTQLTSGLLRIVNTYGLNLRHEDGAAFAMASLVARRGERTADGFAFDWSADLAALDTGDIARRAVQTARFMLDAAPVPSGEYDVIFRREAMADLLETFAGIFSAENAQRRLSLLAGRVGETIAAPCVTIVDDPLLPGGPATCAFDAEGVATYAKHVVEGGVLKTLLHNRSTAHKDGVASTGNASRAGYSAPVRVSPTNFFFRPGELSLEALMAQMGEGLVITDVSGLHAGANPLSGDFSLLSKGFLVRDGKPAQPVEQITVAGNFYDLLKGVRAVADDLKLYPGGVGGTSVWAGKLSVAGK